MALPAMDRRWKARKRTKIIASFLYVALFNMQYVERDMKFPSEAPDGTSEVLFQGFQATTTAGRNRLW